MSKKVETVDQFLARGGTITQVPIGVSAMEPDALDGKGRQLMEKYRKKAGSKTGSRKAMTVNKKWIGYQGKEEREKVNKSVDAGDQPVR